MQGGRELGDEWLHLAPVADGANDIRQRPPCCGLGSQCSPRRTIQHYKRRCEPCGVCLRIQKSQQPHFSYPVWWHSIITEDGARRQPNNRAALTSPLEKLQHSSALRYYQLQRPLFQAPHETKAARLLCKECDRSAIISKSKTERQCHREKHTKTQTPDLKSNVLTISIATGLIWVSSFAFAWVLGLGRGR